MEGPTLLRKGFLEEVRDPKNDSILYSPEKSTLDTLVPIEYVMGKVLKKKNINESTADRIFILESSTGSGKSTVIPPEFYHQFFNDLGGRNICCTQPRVLTSVDIPNSIIKFHTKEMLKSQGYSSREPLIIGKNIGYQTGVLTKKPIKGLIYMTVQILTQQLNIMSDEDFINRYSAIFIDEVHERSIPTDYVLYALKKFMARNKKNKNCPFIFVMSATFDVWKFTDYLLSDVDESKRYENIIRVRGFTFKIDKHFLDYDSANYVQSTMETLERIHKECSSDFGCRGKIGGRGGKNRRDRKGKEQDSDLVLRHEVETYRDILIFVYGASDIKKIKEKIMRLNSGDDFFREHPVIPIELTSETVKHNMDGIFEDIKKLKVEVMTPKAGLVMKSPTRKVFIATNVAETGITIHTLGYVIDTGYYKSNEYDPNFAVNLLAIKPVTKGMSIQRGGRSGREHEGVVYHMYTKDTFDALLVDQFPDIVKDEMTLDLLSLLIREIDEENFSTTLSLAKLCNESGDFWEKVHKSYVDITKVDLLDLPSADSLHRSMEKLFILGAIDRNSLPTKLGFIINRFRFIPIESIKMILSGFSWKVSIIDLITMAAMIEIGMEHISTKILNPEDYQKFVFVVADDFISSLKVFDDFQDFLGELHKSEGFTDIDIVKKWTDQHDLKISGLYKVIELREEIINTLALIGLNPYHNFAESLKFCWAEIDRGESIDQIKLIKQCIFEGYKLNIAVWNQVEKKYFTRKTHKEIKIPLQAAGGIIQGSISLSKYGDSNPHYLIYHKASCVLQPLENIYYVEADAVSVVDGYIPMDVNFDALV